MSVRHYSLEELRALRESPLVAKPDNLPPIEQWIDEAALSHRQQNSNGEGATSHQRQPRQARSGLAGAAAGGEASPMGAFSTGRPTLGTRSSHLKGSNGDDVALGPPRTMFPSSRNTNKTGDEKSSADAGDDADSARNRFFSDRQLNRRSVNEKDGRDSKDSWTSARERRQRGEDVGGEERGFGRHDREHDGERRNGHGDPRWGRDERRNGDRPTGGGWREREAQRRERDHYGEKEPEWMDDPVVQADQELGFGAARNQDEFQKWKESMNKKTKGDEVKEEPLEEALLPVPEPKARVVPLKLDGFENGFFAGVGTAPATTTPGAATPSAASAGPKVGGKGKTSRFASMFKPVEPEADPAPAPVEAPTQQGTNGASQTTAEDQEGFNRMLLMLKGTKVNEVPSPQPPMAIDATPTSPQPAAQMKSMTSNGNVKKSRFANMFDQRSPEPLQSPQGSAPVSDSMFDVSSRNASEGPQQMLFPQRMPERQISEQQISRAQPPSSTMSPDPSSLIFSALREQQPRSGSGRAEEQSRFDPPSRGAASPDINIQNLLAGRGQKHQPNTSNESQALLNLLKKDTSNSRPPSQQAQPHNGNGGMDQAQLHHWLESQRQNAIENQQRQNATPVEPHVPKPRGPQQPPGFIEEQLMRNYPQEQRNDFLGGMSDLQQRRVSQRAPPPGFQNEEMFLQQQLHQQQQAQLRRQFPDGPPPPPQQMQQQQQPSRRVSGHPNLPPMPMPGQGPPLQQFGGDYNHLTSPIGGQQAPPPGFGGMQRHPPGFQNGPPPNAMFQQQPPRGDAGPGGPPPGFLSMGGMQSPPGAPSGPPLGFFGGPHPHQGPPPPQGLPPGFHHQQQMRSPPAVEERGQRIVGGYDGFPPGMIPRRG